MLICKNCKTSLEGNFCGCCGEKAELVGIDDVAQTEETAVENAVEDERMIPRPIFEGELTGDSELDVQTVQEAAAAEDDEETQRLREEEARMAELRQRAKDCARFEITGPVLILLASVLCCPVINIVSFILSVVALVERSTMMRLFEQERYEEGYSAYNVMRSAFRWSWITLIISVAVSILAFVVGIVMSGAGA